MSKTIKFNLILDGYPVRNLEGLREHFSIEDILDYYSNRLLEKWLDVRGYSDELSEVKALSVNKDGSSDKIGIEDSETYQIIKNLIKIFKIETDNASIERDLGILSYAKEREERVKAYKEASYKTDTIIKDYHEGYNSILQHIIDNNDNMALLKADIKEIEKSYLELFRLDFHACFVRFVEEAPKAVYAILANPVLREFYLGEDVPSQIKDLIDEKISPKQRVLENLKDDVMYIQKDTGSVFDPIVNSGTKVMVLYVMYGYVKSWDESPDSPKYGNADIQGKFILLDGLRCASKENGTCDLIYMEV